MPANPTVDFEVLDHTPHVLPLLKSDDETIRVVEMFAGGVGGWKDACTYLQNAHDLKFSTLALEIDRDAALAYSIAHNVPIVNGMKHVDPAIASEFRDLIVLTDIAGDTWLEICSAWQPDIVVISAPCPPWSQAGNASGLHSDQGQLILRAIATCKLLRPRAIALEQVSAFASHEHYKYVMQTLRWAGYVIPILRSLKHQTSCQLPEPGGLPMHFVYRMQQSSDAFSNVEARKIPVPNTWNAMLPEHMLSDDKLFPSQHVL